MEQEATRAGEPPGPLQGHGHTHLALMTRSWEGSRRSAGSGRIAACSGHPARHGPAQPLPYSDPHSHGSEC